MRLNARVWMRGLMWVCRPFDSSELPQAIDAAEVGVSWAVFAVAESGSLVEFALDDAVRLVSTLPRVHIGIFKASTLLENLKDAAAPLRQFYLDHPKNATATFISGPSRTADIEMRTDAGGFTVPKLHTQLLLNERSKFGGEPLS